jgi:hypothetical protein
MSLLGSPPSFLDGSGMGGLSLLQQAEAAFSACSRSVAKFQSQSGSVSGAVLVTLRSAVEMQVRASTHVPPSSSPVLTRPVARPLLVPNHGTRSFHVI